jgi:hypothetical protein
VLVLLHQSQDQARPLHLLQTHHRPSVIVTVAVAVVGCERGAALHDDLQAVQVGHDEGQHRRLGVEENVAVPPRAVAELERAGCALDQQRLVVVVVVEADVVAAAAG